MFLLSDFLIGLVFSVLLVASASPIFPSIDPPQGVNYYVGCIPTVTPLNCIVTDRSIVAPYSHVGNVIYANAIYQMGWEFISSELIEDNKDFSLPEKYYGLGFAEGFLTYQSIYDNVVNIRASVMSTVNDDVKHWMKENMNFIRNKLIPENKGDPYAQKIHHLLSMIEGIAAGYTAGCIANSCSQEMLDAVNTSIIFLYNFQMETGDIATAYKNASEVDDDDDYEINRVSHCTGLVKMTHDDLFFSQVTWSPFETNMRQIKTYRLEGNTFATFSGYPSLIHSSDDWYMNGYGLGILETTVGNDHPELNRKYLRDNFTYVPAYLRTMAATLLARDAKEWTDLYSRYNSGTYNNQWIVLDMKLFRPNAMTQPANLLRVLETYPGTVVSTDETQRLVNATFFGSYNIRYYQITPNCRDCPPVKKSGTNRYWNRYWTYEENPRARIFRRDHHKIVDMASMKSMMRYNDYKNDPYSLIEDCVGAINNTCNPPYSAILSVAARGDLNPPGGMDEYGPGYRYVGRRDHSALDAKIGSYKGIMLNDTHFIAEVISSPPYELVPTFRFSTSPFFNVSHQGLPDKWEFPFLTYSISHKPFRSRW